MLKGYCSLVYFPDNSLFVEEVAVHKEAAILPLVSVWSGNGAVLLYRVFIDKLSKT